MPSCLADERATARRDSAVISSFPLCSKVLLEVVDALDVSLANLGDLAGRELLELVPRKQGVECPCAVLVRTVDKGVPDVFTVSDVDWQVAEIVLAGHPVAVQLLHEHLLGVAVRDVSQHHSSPLGLRGVRCVLPALRADTSKSRRSPIGLHGARGGGRRSADGRNLTPFLRRPPLALGRRNHELSGAPGEGLYRLHPHGPSLRMVDDTSGHSTLSAASLGQLHFQHLEPSCG
mmetsp:Transcript_54040/g.122991  ORF Transcript_54040/g.122991 Transcript_54040/m.122991 type:complete len:233 (-) Transcript_54040:35-733(-)